jgi:hypothetical protein
LGDREGASDEDEDEVNTTMKRREATPMKYDVDRFSTSNLTDDALEPFSSSE